MAFPEDISPTGLCCEICGVRLEDEIVIQEFADGSLVRLCTECAAGAVFDTMASPVASEGTEAAPEPEPEPTQMIEEPLAEPTSSVFPDLTENDPMEMTRELLMPVADLIDLQAEMQVALERLASSLERFATGVISDTMDRTSNVDSRVRALESELERTRTRLRETESLLITTTSPLSPAPQEQTETAPPVSPVMPVVPLPTDEPTAGTAEIETDGAYAPEIVVHAGRVDDVPDPTDALTQTQEPAPAHRAEAVPPLATPEWPTEQAPAAPTQGGVPESDGVFCLEEIRGTQRLFNESPFVERVRSVLRSLGKPKANLSRVAGAEPRVLVTIIWDIIWYQYLVDMRPDIPSTERVTCFREGMEMDELAAHFQEKNAIIDDDGRLDASEMEVRLLSDPTVLITELPVDVEQALEDATEEIWDQRISPEFNWDD